MIRSIPRWLLIGSGVAAFSAATLAVAQPSDPSMPEWREDPAIELRAVRFWAAAAGQTEILAMVGVPYTIATPTGTGSAARIAYSVTVRITDDKGTEFAAETMKRGAPASFRKPGTIGQEQLNFLLAKPGKYFLAVSVLDSVTGKVTNDSIAFDGYSEAPPVSDLLLANSMRASKDTALSNGEIARGNLKMIANSETRIDLTRPSVAFLLEAYTKSAAKAKLSMTLTTVAGEPVVEIQPKEIEIPAGGQIIAHEIPLDGIPEGRYILEAELLMNGKTTARRTTFTVTDPEAAVIRVAEERRLAMRTDQGYFNTLSDAALDSAAEVLSLITDDPRKLQAYDKTKLDTEGKRRFLVNYWQERNNGQTGDNPERAKFYQQISAVNRAFVEPTKVGWKTDRGRIIIKYGAPDDSTYYTGGRGKPILMWKWGSKGKPRWAVFAESGLGTRSFQLVKFSLDEEPGMGNWTDLITTETVVNVVEPFVGQQFFRLGDLNRIGGGGGLQERH